MEIYGPGFLDGPQSIMPTHRSRAIEPQLPAESLQATDSIELSAEAELVGQVQDVADIRADRIAQIRTEIVAGTYETEHRLDVAVGRLLDEIG